MNAQLTFFALFLSLSFFAQNKKINSQNVTINEHIEGTLIEVSDSQTIAILIGGSGPIDRDGNQGLTKSDYLKKLALGLADHNISSLRYDKRVVKQLKTGQLDPNITFEDFVTDVGSIISYVNALKTYSNIVLIGHSQGSLVGMLAVNDSVTGFISLCGPDQNIGDTLIHQVGKSAPEFLSATEEIISELKKGNTTNNYPQALASAFNLETQPFLISWMKYEPTEVIKNLGTKSLIIQGTKDLQVPVSAAEALKASCDTCELSIIKNMNHILVEINGDDLENYKSYNDPRLPISAELLEQLARFILD